MRAKDIENMHLYRTEGLALAINVVKEAQEKGKDPIKELERELRFRGRNKVSVCYTEREIIHNNFEMQDYTVRTILAVALLALDEEFGFRKSRLERFYDEFLTIAKSMIAGDTTGTDLLNYIHAKYGIKIKLRDEKDEQKYIWEEGS